MTSPIVARTVVYRHPCECASASRPLAEGEKPEHRFDVDGEPFPWYITEDGPRFTRLRDDMYLVHVRIIGILRESGEGFTGNIFQHTYPRRIELAGHPFPWVIHEDGITYRSARMEAAYVELAFLAESIDVDCEIADRPTTEVWSFDGNIHRR
ncbi:hypothetical protein [Mycolicibacterium sphagni]|uniref:hypothetical protein n=1 Tax=Mycolicibacterium sphagni TaxID=1786 RepID=UPI0021F3AB03|nr:hypothetical protein [Mycolicibacterium sphagni]MCV7174935.1 hypothetical protein [Mycolicibacterium sphagni]